MSKCKACDREGDGFCGRIKCQRWEDFKNRPDPEPTIDVDAELTAVICTLGTFSGS